MTGELAKIHPSLDPSVEVEGCSDEDLQQIEQLFGHPLPDDYVSAVRVCAGYNGHLLLPDGSEGAYFRIKTAQDVIQSDGYDTVNELGIAVADTGDDWAWVLEMNEGTHRYLEVDLGSGDVFNECATFSEMLEQRNRDVSDEGDDED